MRLKKVEYILSHYDRILTCVGRTDGRTSCDGIVRAMPIIEW